MEEFMKDFKDLKSPIVAVDFDGTIVENAFPRIGEPRKGVIEILKNLKARGAKLILWTCRGRHYLEEAVEACKNFGLEFDAINANLPEVNERMGTDSRKIVADLYIDDRSYNPDDVHLFSAEAILFSEDPKNLDSVIL